MGNKSLLYGIIGFLLGGLLVSIAANTFDKPDPSKQAMDAMVSSLEDKKGDAYDEAFVREMIMHHQGAIDMARLSESRAKHQEVKDLSRAIIEAQKTEIADMQKWQKQWGYKGDMPGGM